MDRLGNQCKEEKEIMINVSDQLLKESKENQDYYVTANVTLTDGTKLSLKKENFYLDGNGIVDSADSSSFPVGVAIEKTATLSLVNDEEQFLGYSFNRAVFAIYMNLELSDGKVETFKRGSFIVCKKPAIDEEINLTLLDYMSKTDRSYETNLTFPCTAGEVLQDSCQTCGITLGDATFKNSDFRVMKKPTGTTHRAVIGMVAALAGGNARIDENDLLRIVTYQAAPKVVKLVEAPWMDASGNNIYDIEENEIIITKEDITIGLKLEEGIDDVQTDIDIITVTGVKYTEDERDYIYGQEGYLIDLKENQLLSGNAEDGVNCIGRILTGFQILPFSVSSIPIGYATFGDAVQFEDYRGNIYRSYATDIEFLFADSTNFSCKAKSVESQGAEYPDENKVLIEQAKEDTRQKMTAYDIKLKQMNELAANTLGFYFTIENLTDGSTIVYRHDKPTLKESKIIYKNGIDGFFLSVDGGETWKSGFDSNGDAVLNILYAIGIQAEYINTRGLTAKDNDGNITFRINADTGEVEINGSSVYIGEKRVDKMLEDMNNTIASAKNMTLQLSNDMQTITSDADGNIPVFPTVTTTAKVMYGSSDITNDCSYTVTKSDSVTGSWDVDTHTYTVTGLSADNGWVDIKATYLINLSVTKRFTLAKQKQGLEGDKGLPGKSPTIRYASMPDGSDMSDNPKYVKLLDSAGNVISDSTGDTIYTSGEAIYVGFLKADAEVDSTNPSDYEWSRYKGTDGLTQYTHLAYANSADGKTDFSVDSPNREYIGMYVDFTEADSTNPDDYAWSLIKGADGADGTPGKAGADGKTPYFHVAYANSEDGNTGFSVDDSANKLYIGQYTDYLPDDSTDPAKYSWTKIKGNDGTPGRTYYLRANAGVLMMGQDKKITPNPFNVHAYYRDGQGDEAAFKTWWIVEYSKDAGKTWTKMAFNSQTSGITINPDNYSLGADGMIRATIYTDSGRTKIADQQTWQVAVDVGMLTQEQIVEILSNGGEFKGLYYLNGHLYISLDALMGNAAILGGTKNGNGYLKIKDKKGTVKGLIDYSGYTAFTSYEENSTRMKYTGICFSDTGINPVSAEKYFSSTADIEYVETAWGIDWTAEELNISATEVSADTGTFGDLTVTNPASFTKSPKIEDMEYTTSSNTVCWDGRTGYKQLMLKSSSSKRYKDIRNDISEQEIENWYNIEPTWAKYKEGYLVKGDENEGRYIPMFIAENVEAFFPEATRHQNGLVEDWNERIMIPAMFAMIKSQKEQLDRQEKLINQLYKKLNIEKEN